MCCRHQESQNHTVQVPLGQDPKKTDMNFPIPQDNNFLRLYLMLELLHVQTREDWSFQLVDAEALCVQS